MLLSLAIFWDS